MRSILTISLIFIGFSSLFAADVTWDGGGSDNNWTTAENWSGDSAPGSSDNAIFDGTSTKNCSIDTNVSVASISINSGYIGTITQNTSQTVTTSGGFTIAAGTFSGGNSTIDVNGDFTQNGGTFTSTSGNLQLGDDITISSGTFTHNSGTAIVDGYTSDIDVGSATFNDFTFNLFHYTWAVITGDVDVDGDLTITTAVKIDGGSISVAGDVVATDSSVYGSAEIIMDGSSNQSLGASGGTGEIPGLKINKTGGTLTISDTIVVGGTGGLTYTAGTVTTTGSTIVIGNKYTIDTGSMIFDDVEFKMTSGQWATITGTMDVDGDLTLTTLLKIDGGTIAASGDVITTDADVGGSATIEFDGSGAQSLNASGGTGAIPGLEVNKSGGTLTIADTIELDGSSSWTQTTGTVSTGSSTIKFCFSSSLTVDAGSVDFNNLEINTAGWANLTITDTLDVNGDLTVTRVNNINTGTIAVAGDVTTTDASINGSATIKLDGTSQTLSAGGGTGEIPSLTISNPGWSSLTVEDTVTVTGDLTITGINNINGTTIQVEDDITTTDSSVGGTATIECTGINNQALSASGGTGGIPGLGITKTGGTLTISDTINIGAGDWTYTSGTVTASSSTIVFKKDCTLDDSTTVFNDVELSMGGTEDFTVTGTMDINGDFTITNSDRIYTGTITVAGDVQTTDASIFGDGLIEMDGSGAQTLDANGGSGAIPGLKINKSAGTLTLADTIIIDGTGNWTYVSGTVDAGTSTVAFKDAATIDAGSTSFNDVEFSMGGTQVVTVTGTMDIDGDLTITQLREINTGTLTVAGDITSTDNSNYGTSTIELNGTGAQSISGGGMLAAELIDINKASGTVTLTGALDAPDNVTLTDGTLDAAGYSLTIDGTFTLKSGTELIMEGGETHTIGALDAQSGSLVNYDGSGSLTLNPLGAYDDVDFTGTATWALASDMDIDGDLDVQSGTFDLNAKTLFLSTNWSVAGANFSANSGTVVFDGGSQTINGDNTFYNLVKHSSAGDTLTFEANKTQTVTGDFDMRGVSGTKLLLRSSSAGTQWKVDAQGSRPVAHLDVKDSNNIDATAITVANSTDSGNNTNWTFDNSLVITLTLATDSNHSIIQENTTVELTVTAPDDLTAYTIDLSQAIEPGGTGEIYFGATGTDTTKQVVTSGASGDNSVTIDVQFSTVSAFEDDINIRASESSIERGDTFGAAITASVSPACVYLADQRPVTQTLTMTPAIAGVQFNVVTKMNGGAVSSMFGLQDWDLTDASGSASQDIRPCRAESYGLSGTKGDGTKGEGSMSDYKENCPTEGKGHAPSGSGETTDNDTHCYGSDHPDAPEGCVDSLDGEVKEELIDLVIPGRGIPFVIKRGYHSYYYRSMMDHKDTAVAWSFSYIDEYLVKDGDLDADSSNYVNMRSGNSINVYANMGVNDWEAAIGSYTQLKINATTGDFEIREEDGDMRIYHDFDDTSTPNKNGRLKEMRDRNDNSITFHYESIDPDNTVSSDDKYVLAYAIDTLGREIRFQYYAKTAQTVNGRSVTIVGTSTGQYGRLARIIDFKGDMDFSDTDASEDFADQINNRTFVYDYDDESNLVRFSSPAVDGTPTSNDFANGKTYRYQYYTDSHHPGFTQGEWDALSDDQQNRLLHKLTHVWYPNEVQNSPTTNPADADAALVYGYETDTSDTFFGFAVSADAGGTNDNGVPSGGSLSYVYTELNANRSMPGGVYSDPTKLFSQQSLQVDITDRNGNEATYIYGGGKTLLTYEEKTNGLRTGEPTEFTTTHEVNQDRISTSHTLPEGNKTEWTQNENSTDRFQQGNLIRIVKTPDITRGADQDAIEEVFVYEPIYNRPCLHVTARGSNSTDNDFTPPIADVVTRTMTDPYDATRTLDLRYATVEYFDYQESTEEADDAPDSRLDIDGSGGKVNLSPLIAVDATVLTVEVWLVQELGLPETSAGLTELRDRLSDNLTNLGLGDLNGDNDATPTIAGNIIRTIKASPVLVEDSNQHALESDIETAGDLIDQTKTYANGGSNESTSGDRLQTIVTMRQYNSFGQLAKVITPEGNVITYEYFAENDADGDGTTTPTPADGRTLNTTSGGYLKERVVDNTRSYYDQSGTDKSSATFSNNNTDPAETEITGSFTYDDVGNQITFTNPRGIRTDYFVNELNQRVRTTRAADIGGVSTASPSDPLYNHSDTNEKLTAFAYKKRLLFDYNDNMVLRQIEDRNNTSGVDGNGLGTIPTQASDTTPGLTTADSIGGDSYVDYLALYDRLDNQIEKRVEIDGSNSLDTKYRFDGNQNTVLIILPEGNADSMVYDERDLIFQEIYGCSVRPTAGLYATGDPTTFNRAGGSGTSPSTITYNYDDNENLIELVDAADTDENSANNSSIAGVGDATSFTYDGYDRKITIVDPLGNKTTNSYDPDDNLVRVILDGDPENDIVGTSGNKTLSVSEYIHDNRNRVIFIHEVLFETQDHTPTNTPTLTDGADMDTISIYLSDANSDTAAVPGAIAGLTIIGRVTSMQEYDRQSRSTFEVLDDMDTYLTDYDGASRSIKITDSAIASGFNTTTKVFDPDNIDGNTIERAYDDNNNIIEQLETDVTTIANVADETFRKTFIYDSLGNTQVVIDSVGQAIDCRYDSRRNKISCSDANGPVTTRSFNRRGLGSSASVTINDYGNVIRYIYDGFNRELEEEVRLTSSGKGDGTNIGATLEGVFSTAPTVDATQSGDGLISTHYAYDDNSQLLGIRDDNGNTTVFIYDNQNRKLTERKGLAETGTSFTITGGDSGSFNVALRGSATTPVDTEASGTDNTYTYDEDSNIVTWKNEGDVSGNRSTMTNSYDALNRRKSNTVSNPIGSAFIGTTLQTWEYDGLSRLTECADNNDPTPTSDDLLVTCFHDSLSRLVEEEQKIGSTTSKKISYDYDIQTGGCTSKYTSLTFPDSRVIDATYDALDRLIDKTDNGQSAAIGTYEYMGAWRVGVLSYQNDTRLTYVGQVSAQNANVGYDGLRRIIDQRWELDATGTTALGNGSLVIGFGYQDNSGNSNYDRMDHVLIEEKQHGSQLSEVYEYDSAYRLIEIDRGTLNSGKTAINTLTTLPGSLQNQTFTLDGVYNWNTNNHTSQGGTQQSESRTHTDFNEIAVVSGTPYGSNSVTGTHIFDKNGNITDDGVRTYKWDALNRLREVSRKSDGKLIGTYSYDCDGRRFRKVITNGGLSSTESNLTVNYYYHEWQVIEERDGSDVITYQYVYGNYIDEPMVIDDRSATIAQLNDGSGSDRQFYHYNKQYSIHSLTDEAGSITEGYVYDAYGRQTVFSNSGVDGTWFTNDDTQAISVNSFVGNPYGFTGRRFDNESEIWHFRLRYIDSDTGRFINRDPLGYVDGWNLLNSYFAINFTDPYGAPLHHPHPLHLGGADEPPLIDLTKEQHKAAHRYFREQGFPPGDEGREKWKGLTDKEREKHIQKSLEKAGVDKKTAKKLAKETKDGKKIGDKTKRTGKAKRAYNKAKEAAKKKVTKGGAKAVGGKLASRFVPILGWIMTANDAYGISKAAIDVYTEPERFPPEEDDPPIVFPFPDPDSAKDEDTRWKQSEANREYLKKYNKCLNSEGFEGWEQPQQKKE